MVSSDTDEIVHEVNSFYRLYKSGRVERFYNEYDSVYISPSQENPTNGVFSKDISISANVSARLYLPQNTTVGQKLPVLVYYYHGGGLVVESAFYNRIHYYVNQLAYELNVVAVSVEYRLAPEVDVLTIYEDCWTALQWVASHASEKINIDNNDSWLKDHGDFSKIFLAGDSAGGNLVYHMSVRAGKEVLNNEVKITGSILAYPYFLFPNIDIDEEGPAYKIWVNICPSLIESGLLSPIDSPLINPLSGKATSLSGLGCSRILVCGGKEDDIIPLEIVVKFVEGLKKSGWNGECEYLEVDDGHAFQIYKPESEEAKHMMKCYVDFVHR